jgi:hypothetical protein
MEVNNPHLLREMAAQQTGAAGLLRRDKLRLRFAGALPKSGV